ncbi:hypothetical protein PBAL39_03869 [Pedobacter sp. BAL39]|uniref:3-keto-disaccharide hydrolase n=1 Tax=Pedobacter sp. BAL39 TaxID=391596 RepID=UPI0001559547|nr:DUF1080 domain-containing protein [Pedobacter sp. BAL39]EDM35649.1 hypothetical protein PBAL39_03869 [Pedobacter sp. BAL39]
MKKYIVSALLLTAIAGVNTIQAQSVKKGFKALSDGKTTAGWHTYGQATAGEKWKVEDGAFHLDPSVQNGGGDLITDKEYTNFHLIYDWKVAPNANSGVIFYVKEDKEKYHATYSTGLEMQVIDNDGHPDAKNVKHRAADLYDIIASSSEPVKPVGEWNTGEIISKNGKLELKLNGVTVVKTTLWNDDFKALLAKSKFATWKDFAAFKTGKIALQDHGDEVWYRNIMIKEL